MSETVYQADQICYAVLCVFSYVAAGSDKRLHMSKASTVVSMATTPMLTVPTITRPVELTKDDSALEETTSTSKESPVRQVFEAGSITPVGGPPSYPPPDLPPGVPPPAPPPGLKGYGVPVQVSGAMPVRPPPVPSRNLPPQPPPRPK